MILNILFAFFGVKTFPLTGYAGPPKRAQRRHHAREPDTEGPLPLQAKDVAGSNPAHGTNEMPIPRYHRPIQLTKLSSKPPKGHKTHSPHFPTQKRELNASERHFTEIKPSTPPLTATFTPNPKQNSASNRQKLSPSSTPKHLDKPPPPCYNKTNAKTGCGAAGSARRLGACRQFPAVGFPKR